MRRAIAMTVRHGLRLRPGSTAMDLFASPMTQLLDDAEGGVRYWPSFVDADTADAWFEALQRADGNRSAA